MNLISTLSFLLESRNMRQVKIDFTCLNHPKISLLLQKDTLTLYLEDYIGAFDQDDENQKIAKLYLTIYLELLPFLIQEYNTDISNGLWNNSKYINFIKEVSDELTKKIKNKIDSISSK